MAMMTSLVIAGAWALGWVPPAGAASGGADGGAAAEGAGGQAAAPGGVLQGPRLSAGARTLVERDLHGVLRRLDLPPAEAALGLLDLDAASRARAERVLTERARVMDGIVSANYGLLIEMFSAGQAGDVPDAVRVAVVLAGKLRPLRDRGPLETELARAVGAEAGGRLLVLVREYREAVAAEGAIENGVVRRGATRWEALSSEALRLWGEQIRRSFERQSADGAVFFDQVLRALRLKPEQEARSRERLARFAEETGLQATPAQERALFIDLAAWMDKGQLQRLAKLVKGGPEALLRGDDAEDGPGRETSGGAGAKPMAKP